MQVLRDSTPVARKAYICNASEFIRESLYSDIFTIADLRKIVKAKRQGYAIQPGQKYIKEVQVDNREIVTFRAIPEMDDLCRKYDLYAEW